jgi:hypothetical protein
MTVYIALILKSSKRFTNKGEGTGFGVGSGVGFYNAELYKIHTQTHTDAHAHAQELGYTGVSNRWVLRADLKAVNEEECLMPAGREFQITGPT